jgi:hypothetical protein
LGRQQWHDSGGSDPASAAIAQATTTTATTTSATMTMAMGSTPLMREVSVKQ